MATRFASKWLVLGIDLVTIAVSFFLAYLIRFNMSVNFDLSHFALQLPLIVLIALIALQVTGTYKGLFQNISNQYVSNISKAISLSAILIILLIIVNRKWEIYHELSIPLSIVFIYSLLALAGLIASHYILKAFFNSIVNKKLN